MLSVRKIDSSKQAGHYFSAADYYVNGDDKDSIKSEWNGSAAKVLGLSGEVDIEKFKSLLDGHVDNQVLGRVEDNGVINHKCGWDFTFSAPKSVSILSILGGDKDLLIAHNEAVKHALSVLEEEVITRKMQDGVSMEHSTKNAIFASFTHTTSRSLDPQLHTHNVLMNMTKDNDKWMSIESKPLYDLKMIAGLEYRLKLSELVKEAGYSINMDYKKGTFEIDSVSSSLISHFSKRSKEIRAKAEELGVQDSKKLETIALNSRDSKEHSSTQERLEDWGAQLKEMNLEKDLLKALSNKEEAAQTKETNQAKEEAAQTKETNQAKEEAAQIKE
jgi:conjugative relaxase-like TrwC/TraI family protein